MLGCPRAANSPEGAKVNDQVTGKVFGGELEKLRRVAVVYLPRMADDYTAVTSSMSQSVSGDSVFQRSGDFGPQALKTSWASLRDVLWTSADQTSDNLYSLASGLKKAMEDFAAQDSDAARELNDARAEFEANKGPGGQEWSGPYQNSETAPALVNPPIPAGAGGN